MTCAKCGCCCKGWRIPVQPFDDPPDPYTVGTGAFKSMRTKNNGECFALEADGTCGIYDKRPSACRAFLCVECGGTGKRPDAKAPNATAVYVDLENSEAAHAELREAVGWLCTRIDEGKVDAHNSHGLELEVDDDAEGDKGHFDHWADVLVRLYRRHK